MTGASVPGGYTDRMRVAEECVLLSIGSQEVPEVPNLCECRPTPTCKPTENNRRDSCGFYGNSVAGLSSVNFTNSNVVPQCGELGYAWASRLRPGRTEVSSYVETGVAPF